MLVRTHPSGSFKSAGPIPAALGRLTALILLDLGCNNLTGTLLSKSSLFHSRSVDVQDTQTVGPHVGTAVFTFTSVPIRWLFPRAGLKRSPARCPFSRCCRSTPGIGRLWLVSLSSAATHLLERFGQGCLTFLLSRFLRFLFG